MKSIHSILTLLLVSSAISCSSQKELNTANDKLEICLGNFCQNNDSISLKELNSNRHLLIKDNAIKSFTCILKINGDKLQMAVAGDSIPSRIFKLLNRISINNTKENSITFHKIQLNEKGKNSTLQNQLFLFIKE